MGNKTITYSDFEKVIPDSLKGLLVVDSRELPNSFQPIVEAFGEAARCIAPVIRMPKRVNTIISTNPFTMNMSTGTLTYSTNDPVINASLNDIVFIECNKMMGMKHQFRVVCILEELVHVFLNVTNENLVTRIVGWLYDGINIVNGKYTLKNH